MRFNETTIRILVRNNYGECFDFYTEKIGLAAVWGLLCYLCGNCYADVPRLQAA